MDKIEVSQRAREAAAALWESKDGVVSINAANTRLGRMDDMLTVQAFARFERDILATHTDVTPVAEPCTIYVQWADNGAIRKWAWAEFDLAEKLKVETLPVSDTPFAWAYHYTQKHPGQIKPGAMDIKRDRHKGPIASGWTETPLYTHPPATDVAALVEAAFREGWHDGMMAQGYGGSIESTDDDDWAASKARQALAPFTKGQP